MKTVEHPNVGAYRRTADAFRAGDFDVIRSLVAEDVVWRVPWASRSGSTMCWGTTSTSVP
jgi:ketosteroid isomerase-like protein